MTLWLALVLVLVGGLIALFGIADRRGGGKPEGASKQPFRTLMQSFAIVRSHPKVELCCLVRAINTSAEFGFPVMLPIYFTRTLISRLGNGWR